MSKSSKITKSYGMINIINNPTLPQNVASKSYVDSSIISGGTYRAGNGLILTTGTFSVNPNQNQITSITSSSLAISSIITASNSTASTTTSTGALVVTGGVGIGGSINSTSLTTGPFVSSTLSSTTGTFSGLVTASNGLTVTSGSVISNANISHKGVQLVVGVSAATTIMSSIVPGLVLTGSGGISGYTVTLPSTPIDGQVIFISTTQAIAATFLLSGGTVSPTAPTSLTAGQSLRYVYNIGNTTWYQI